MFSLTSVTHFDFSSVKYPIAQYVFSHWHRISPSKDIEIIEKKIEKIAKYKAEVSQNCKYSSNFTISIILIIMKYVSASNYLIFQSKSASKFAAELFPRPDSNPGRPRELVQNHVAMSRCTN